MVQGEKRFNGAVDKEREKITVAVSWCRALKSLTLVRISNAMKMGWNSELSGSSTSPKMTRWDD